MLRKCFAQLTPIWMIFVFASLVAAPSTSIIDDRTGDQNTTIQDENFSTEERTAIDLANMSFSELEDYVNGGAVDYHWGNHKISNDEEISGDLVTLDGDLFFAGRTDGNILVINGDLYLRDDAIVGGDIRVIGGKIHGEVNAIVRGAKVQSNVKLRISEENGFVVIRSQRKFRWNKRINEDRDDDREYKVRVSFLFSPDDTPVGVYNRVDGLTMPFGFALESNRPNTPRFKAIGLYRTGTGDVGYDVSIEKPFFQPKDFIIGVNFHSFTDTNDDYRMGNLENSLAAFFLKEDFRNYFEREGYTIFASQKLTSSVTVKMEYSRDSYSNLFARDHFSLFGEGKDFSPNPSIDTGDISSFSWKLIHDSRNDDKDPRTGWFNEIEVEKAGKSLGGDFDFVRGGFTIRRYNRISRDNNLDIRLKVETASDPLPLQRHQVLGGIGGLRGFREGNREGFYGDRLFLLNVEYRLGLNRRWAGLIFFDTGLAYLAEDPTKFTDIIADKLGDLNSDFGLGLRHREGFGVYIAQNLNDSTEGPRITVRLNRDF